MFFFTNQNSDEDLFKAISKLPKDVCIIFRQYHLGDDQRLDLVRKIKKQGFQVLFSKSWKLAKLSGADGVHYSDFDSSINVPKNRGKMIFSFSCHSEKSLKKARNIGCDLVFYSPIFKSNSHPQQKGKGVFALKNFVSKSSIPTFALGGINEKKFDQIKNSGISGIGGITIFSC